MFYSSCLIGVMELMKSVLRSWYAVIKAAEAQVTSAVADESEALWFMVLVSKWIWRSISYFDQYQSPPLILKTWQLISFQKKVKRLKFEDEFRFVYACCFLCFLCPVAHGWKQPDEWAACQSDSDWDRESFAGNRGPKIQPAGGLARDEPRVSCTALLSASDLFETKPLDTPRFCWWQSLCVRPRWLVMLTQTAFCNAKNKTYQNQFQENSFKSRIKHCYAHQGLWTRWLENEAT